MSYHTRRGRITKSSFRHIIAKTDMKTSAINYTEQGRRNGGGGGKGGGCLPIFGHGEAINIKCPYFSLKNGENYTRWGFKIYKKMCKIASYSAPPDALAGREGELPLPRTLPPLCPSSLAIRPCRPHYSALRASRLPPPHFSNPSAANDTETFTNCIVAVSQLAYI